MHLNDVGMVAANTTRSRVYLQALVQSELVPSFVLVMEEGGQHKWNKPLMCAIPRKMKQSR